MSVYHSCKTKKICARGLTQISPGSRNSTQIFYNQIKYKALTIAVHQITGPRHRELILHHTRNNNITSCSAVLTTRRTAGAAAPPTKETELVQQWTLDRPEPLTSDPTDHREATDTKTPALPSAGSPIREPDGPLTEIYNSLTPNTKNES